MPQDTFRRQRSEEILAGLFHQPAHKQAELLLELMALKLGEMSTPQLKSLRTRLAFSNEDSADDDLILLIEGILAERDLDNVAPALHRRVP